MRHCELLIDGHFIGGPCDQAVGKTVIRNPFDGSLVGTAAEGGYNELRAAIDAAHDAFASWRRSDPAARARLLNAVADRVEADRDELALLLTDEVGKPIAMSRAEVSRLATTFRLGAEEAGKLAWLKAELGPDSRAGDYEAGVARLPLGVVFGIVPYNWPFNLAAHKLAPAIASGNTVVLKTSPLAPLSTLSLGRILHECGCPPGVVNVVNAPAQATERALKDPRVQMLSFTGSAAVGWKLKQLLYDRRVTLELGGDASVIVAESANVDWAVHRIVAGAFGYAGQICISVQHAWVHNNLYEEVRTKLIAATRACKIGDPREESTVCGPVIDEANAARLQEWIEEAILGGATLLAGGTREGTLVRPTLLADVPPQCRLATEEAFGPVLTLARYDTLSEAIERTNASKYGIHCGVFVRDEVQAAVAIRDLEVGGVVLNDSPTVRFDSLPYGGLKQSGFGREGLRYAIEEMTDLRSIVRRRGVF